MRKSTRRRRNSKRMRKSRKMMGGGCGCSAVKPMMGGSGPSQYFYPLNTYENDPNNVSALTSTRNMANMVGGKRRRKKCKKCGKMLGGGSLDVLSSFGTTTGAMSTLSLANNSHVNPAPYDQAVAQMKTTLV